MATSDTVFPVERREASVDSLDIFLREAAGDYAGPMDRAKESELSILAQSGCAHSLDRLVRANSRFVISIAKKYQNRGVALKDLIQEGNIGMIRGIRKFDPERGVKLISYAVWWIRQALQDAIAEQGRNVRVGRNRDAAVTRLRRANERLTARLGRVPSENELAHESELTADQVQVLATILVPEVRLDAMAFQADGPTNGEILGPAVGPDAVDLLQDAETSQLVEAALAKLRPREAKIVRLYFGLSDHREHTLQEIGDMIGLTRERVRQLRDRALKELSGDFRLVRAFGEADYRSEAPVTRQRNRSKAA
jgi:RNA polymerase primary sigma factor